jgi:hypothetical protein
LGYEYGGANDTSYGKRMHVEGDFEPGKAKGLKLLYNILLRIFRENIVLSSGNEDDIRGALVDLLLYSHRICRHGDEEPPLAPLDVVDFIYKEMYLCMLDVKKEPIYAPFIMKLILQKAPTCPLTRLAVLRRRSPRLLVAVVLVPLGLPLHLVMKSDGLQEHRVIRAYFRGSIISNFYIVSQQGA